MGPAAMWTAKMRAGRFVYKGLYLFGPIATVLLLALLLRPPSRFGGVSLTERLRQPSTRTFFLASLGLLLGDLFLFWRFPIEVSYAIPAAFFLLLIAGTTTLLNARVSIALLVLSIFSLNFVLIELARPNIPGMATGARFHFGFTEGTTLQDIHDRLPVRECRTNDCWTLHGTLPGH